MIMQQRHTRSKLWPGMIFALLGLNFTVVGLTIYAASAKASSHAVEPDYDRKALNWNQSARQFARNKQLGWALHLTEIGSGIITASLLDRDGRAITDADVSLEAFHHAHAGDRLFADLRETQGSYRGTLATSEPGLWEFRFTVTRARETFTSTLTRIITEGGAGS